MKSRERLSSDISRKKNPGHTKKSKNMIFDGFDGFWWFFHDLNTFSMIFTKKLLKDLGFSGNFRNVSNFEELYLRAQGIFFDGTGTVVKIYV